MIVAFFACLFAAALEPATTVPVQTGAVITVEKTLNGLETTSFDVASSTNKTAQAQEGEGKKVKDKNRTVKITSVRTDYDRREGVIMFDRNVFVDDPEYKLHADRVYVFMDGTNDLKRIVAIGNVAVTNDLRSGTCAKATYSRATSKLVMYGDSETGTLARLEDNGKKRGELLGRKITFWTDTEQVEVEGSQITVDAQGAGGSDAAKKLFGK